MATADLEHSIARLDVELVDHLPQPLAHSFSFSSFSSRRSVAILRSPSLAVHSASVSIDELARDLVDLLAAGRGPHELRAPVLRVRHTLDVAVALEVRDELGHRLLRHLRAIGEHAHARAALVEELEHVAVRRAHLRVPALGEALVQARRGDPERLAQEDPEVVGTGALAGAEREFGLTLDRKPVYPSARPDKTGNLSFEEGAR